MAVTVYSKTSKRALSQRRLETYDQYTKIIQWGRKYPVDFTRRVFGIELLDYQKYTLYNTWPVSFAAWVKSRNAGKALDLKTPVWTPTGAKLMEEITVGDWVLDENCNPVRVTAISPVFLGHPCYEVKFTDGERIVADGEHLWGVYAQDDYKVLNTAQMVKDYLTYDKGGTRPVYKYQVALPASQGKKFKTIVGIDPVASVPTKCIRVDSPSGLFLCGEKGTVTHNSTEGAIYAMLRSVLYPSHVTYFISNVGAQAKETFLKMEHIAKQEIPSFANCTDVFYNEIELASHVSSGFVHDVGGFRTKLFNASEILTLNSDPTNVKGRRANLIYLDEAGWITEELMVQVEQFTNQNENFILGTRFNPLLEPKQPPRQIVYASSASDTDSTFYRKVREYTKQMMKGDTQYFVCDFDIDAVMSATVNGSPLPEPLISKKKVEQAILLTPDKAARELYNKFSANTHDGQILTQRDIMQHTKPYLPILRNEDGKGLFVFSWDTARLGDNSIIEVAQFIQDKETGWRMRMANVNSLVDPDTKKHTPKTMPEQVSEFKEMLLAYNGTERGRLDYECIKAVVCDAGAGGQMIGGVSDYLLEEWKDVYGKTHKGLIDRKHKANETAKLKYPDAVDIVHLVDPKPNRNLIFQSIKDMVRLGVVEFPMDYDVTKDYVLFTDEEGNETQHNLSLEEQVSLENMELLKLEIITMCETSTNGTVNYNFPPEKRNVMHDDRVFAFGLLCWYLAQLRREQVVKPVREETDYLNCKVFATEVEF